MTPQEFIEKWSRSELKESAGSQEHFIDLCRLLGERTPADIDATGDEFTFEKGAMKTGGGSGWADVWKKGCFAWEYKGKHANLDRAFEQLQRYAIALENPPLLIVSDMQRFIIHTNWTNTVEEVHELELEELLDERRRQLLKYAFTDPGQLKPKKTKQDLTEQVAADFARLAQHLRERGHDAEKVAHFVNRLVFCMFAEDVGLLPNHMFTRMLEHTLFEPQEFEEHSQILFSAMREGGRVGFEKVEWFNGGLFDNDDTLPLNRDDIGLCLKVARLDWSNIEPSIMGTLFERGLDPDKRSQLGAHYTDHDKIMLIVNPVIVEPLTNEWRETRSKIEALAAEREKHEAEIAAIRAEGQEQLASQPEKAKAGEEERRKKITAIRGRITRAENTATELRDAFVDRLRNFRVLDPACGSGNFLYLSLQALKDLEHKVNLEAEILGIPRRPPQVGPECLKGIEINPFAAELARVCVWVGEIQWMRSNGFSATRDPILKPLGTIECRDALLNEDGTEAEWPEADVIVGNPPFLGAAKFLRDLGETYTDRLRKQYGNAIPGGADLVTYWFHQAKAASEIAKRVGFVATSKIRYSESNRVLTDFAERFQIYAAWSDEPWIQEGASVRVSLICGHSSLSNQHHLDGKFVESITPRLTESYSAPAKIEPNPSYIFRGPPKVGPFDIEGDIAREWLGSPVNPNGKANSEVLRPIWNAYDVTRNFRDRWIVDFNDMEVSEAALYERPFAYVEEHVRPFRANNRREWRRENWWLHAETVPALRSGMLGKMRIIVTPMVSRYRIFRWMPVAVLPDQRLMAICLDDDTSFGVLCSHHHEIWTLSNCSWHGVGNDPVYNAGSVFGTFPFPDDLTPDIPAADYADDPRAGAIAEAAKRLNELRENWLNPEDLVERVPEVVEGYPDRIVPKDEKAAAILKKRTLTNLYNERPAWLDHAHKALDEAVAAAYGWPADLSDDEILERLFKLNQERAAAQVEN